MNREFNVVIERDSEGTDADDAHKSLRFLCERKGWQLLEVYLLQPTHLAFAFDRDAATDAYLTKEEKSRLIPQPATRGQMYRPLSPAQLRQARRQQRQENAIRATFPLLAEILISTEFAI